MNPAPDHRNRRPHPVAVVVLLVVLAACSSDATESPIPTSAPVLTTAASAFTTTTTTLPPGPKLYEIQPGDVLSVVAEEAGMTLEELLQANPTITDPGLISVGQTIVIPYIPEIIPGENSLEVPDPSQPSLPALTSTTATTEPDVTTSTAAG